MGGWETLIWNRIVRMRYPEWVNTPSFVVSQFDMKGLPARPHTLDFVDKIKVEILLEHKITGSIALSRSRFDQGRSVFLFIPKQNRFRFYFSPWR